VVRVASVLRLCVVRSHVIGPVPLRTEREPSGDRAISLETHTKAPRFVALFLAVCFEVSASWCGRD
jgi:hypothetical protein